MIDKPNRRLPPMELQRQEVARLAEEFRFHEAEHAVAGNLEASARAGDTAKWLELLLAPAAGTRPGRPFPAPKGPGA